MLTTTRRGVQYPNSDRSDRADVAVHMGYLATALDVDVLFNQGTDAARIAAAHQAQGGRFWWTTDTLIMWYDDGAAWRTVGSIAAGSITGALIQDGTITDVDIAVNAAIQILKLAGFPNDRTRYLLGDGSWAVPTFSGPNTRTASYVLTLPDNNGIVEMNVAGTVTIPADATTSFPVGSQVTIAQMAAGQSNISGAGGVTVRAYNGNLRLAGQNAVASCIKRAANDWWVAGNLVP